MPKARGGVRTINLRGSIGDLVLEEEFIRRNNAAYQIASLNSIIHRQNLTTLELKTKIEQMESTRAASSRQQPSVASTLATHPTLPNSAPSSAKNQPKVKIPPIIIMEEETVIPEIIAAHLEKLPNKYTLKKGAKCTKVSTHMHPVNALDYQKKSLAASIPN